MRSALIGHTGFVGSNLASLAPFTDFYNSKNIEQIEGQSFDVLVCSGVSAVKWWANKNAEEDRRCIDGLIAHLHTIKVQRFFLISTVDVYPLSVGVNEDYDCHASANHAYGTNRLHFEDAVLGLFPDAHVARLPGLFGRGLKKNLIFDLLKDNNVETINLESKFQFYDVAHLWKDLLHMEQLGLKLANLVTEPVRMREIVARAFDGKKVGDRPSALAEYDIRTLHADALGGRGDYLSTKEDVLIAIRNFVEKEIQLARG